MATDNEVKAKFEVSESENLTLEELEQMEKNFSTEIMSLDSVDKIANIQLQLNFKPIIKDGVTFYYLDYQKLYDLILRQLTDSFGNVFLEDSFGLKNQKDDLISPNQPSFEIGRFVKLDDEMLAIVGCLSKLKGISIESILERMIKHDIRSASEEIKAII